MAAETDKVEPADSEQDEVEDVYEVERIIDMRVEEGDVLYRVRWKNYCSDDDTWEPEAHLEDCREVLSALKKSLADAKLKTEAEVKKNVKLLPAKSDVFDADSESDSDKDRPVEAPIKKKKKILQEDDEPPPKDKRKKKRKGKQMEGVRPAPETDEEEEERAPTPPSTPKEKKTDSKKRLVDSEEDNDDGVPSKKNKKEKGKEGGKYKKEKGEDGKKKKGKKVRKIKTMEDYLSDGPSESQMDNTTSSKTAKTVTKSIEKASLYDRFTQKKGRWEVKLQCIKDLIYDNKSKKPDTAQKESSLQKLKSLTSKSKDENAPHSDSSDSSTLHKKVKSKGQESTSALPKVPSSTTSSSSSSSVTAAVNTSVKEEEDPTGSTNLFEKCLLNCEAKDRAPHHQPVPQPPAEKNNNKPTENYLKRHEGNDVNKANTSGSNPFSKVAQEFGVSQSDPAVSSSQQASSTVHILSLLLRLRQCCCHLSLLKKTLDSSELQGDGIVLSLEEQLNALSLSSSPSPSCPDPKDTVALNGTRFPSQLFENTSESTKIAAIVSELKAIRQKSDDQKSVIVSQWTSMLHIVAVHLRRMGLRYGVIDGTVNPKRRMDLVEEFNTNPKGPQVMLVSLCAGGVGLNLTGGNHLFLIDMHWNPALEDQACDRIYRVGQRKDVTIHRFVCEETVEEKISALQVKKKELAQNVLSGTGSTFTKLSLADLKIIFGV